MVSARWATTFTIIIIPESQPLLSSKVALFNPSAHDGSLFLGKEFQEGISRMFLSCLF